MIKLAFSFSFLLMVACNIAPKKGTKSDVHTFENIRYSRRFGILTGEGYQQIFYLNNKDTQWSQRFEDEAGLPRIAVLSTVFAGFMELLERQDLIVAIDNEKFYSDSLLLDRFKNGNLESIGVEGQIQLEKLIALKPDYVIAGDFELKNNPVGQRLEQLGIKILICDNFKEQHPLARAEWIRFFGVITKRSMKADSIFNQVEKRYLEIADKCRKETGKVRPRVLVDAMYGDSWFVPGGLSFTARLVDDAGGDYVFRDRIDLITCPLTLEDVLVKGGNADIWIHTNQYKTLEELKNSDNRYTLFKPYTDKKIFNNNKKENASGGNDYWEKGVGRPDLILSDLFTIFHEDTVDEKALNYYTQLGR